MTNRNTLSLLCALGVTFAGCVPAVNPLYTEKDLAFDPALLGRWVEKEKENENTGNGWKFEKRDEHSYKLTITDGDKTSPLIAHLVRLGEHRFLDLCPDKAGLEDIKRDDFYKVALIRGHLILKVSRIEPSLQMSVLDVDWLGKLLEKEPKAIAHQEMLDGGVFFTATTKELQEFFLKHVNTEGAWGDKVSEWVKAQ